MIFDLVVFAAILISCLIAFLRGLIREVLTILGVIGGVAAAVSLGPKLTPIVAGWLNHHKEKVAAAATQAGDHADKAADAKDHADRLFGLVPYDTAAELIAYCGVFILVVIVLSVISHFLSKGAKKIGLGAVDRTLGVFFGAIRAVVLLGLLYMPFYVWSDDAADQSWFGDSHTRVYVRATSAWMYGFIPKNATRDFDAAADKASASMAGATRDKLLKIDALQDKTALKDKAEKAGDAAKENGNELVQRLRNAGAALRGAPVAGQPAYSSATPQQPGYGAQQRGQMDSLIHDENANGNAGAPAGKTGQ